jgi:crotonobetainyl-CoA:carnitine CoA-transferase CaiB-like acyl-CoA transferase
VADLTTGMFMAFAIANALYHRAQTGRGQRIDTNLFASGLAAQYRPLLSVEEQDRPVRDGFLQELTKAREHGLRFDEAAALRAQYIPARGRNNYYRIYEAQDGLVAVACLNNRQRRGMRDALGIDDPSVEGRTYDWFSEEVRRFHRAATEALEQTFRERTVAAWLALLEPADVPCGPVHFPEEIYENEHVQANGLLLEIEHPVLGRLRMPACPIAMSETPAGSLAPPPVLGADGPDVLRELGYDDAAIARLLDDSVLTTRERLLQRDG